MRFKRRSPCLVLTALVLLLLPAAAMAADVDVFAEGAYNAQYLDVFIYANINNGVKLCSYGVKLHYNSLLTTPTAAKNDAVWYFGTTGDKKGYMDPAVNTTDREITFIGGKLDTSSPTSPTDGVTGTRVLLGSARFVRTESSLGLGTSAKSYFNISVERGKASPYDNFVTTGGTVKDSGVVYSAMVWQRGDANGDGSLNVQDMSTVKTYIISGGIPYPWMNCNGDSAVNVQDVSCIKGLIMTGHY